MRRMNLSDIKIPEAFEETFPSEFKMNECREAWNNWHRQDRFVVVNNNGYLLDGYVQYLILKENGIEEAEVKISNVRRKRWRRKNVEDWVIPKYRTNSTTYIYGIHPNEEKKKERVWRVPESWVGWADSLLPGDDIFVCTKNGIAPLTITKIEVLDKCPVDFKVRKVAKHRNI